MAAPPSLAVYVHVPFCHLRCNFCNLHAYGMGDYAGLPSLRADYTEAVCAEVGMWAEQVGRAAATTVFFGGGTPTELSVAQLGAILASICHYFDVAEDAEITVEGYPGLPADDLAGLRLIGVNRVSFGVQSFEPRLAALLDRHHTLETVRQTVASAQALGLSVALDFIYGLPTQTLGEWNATLDQAIAVNPDHLSLYALSIEEATRLRALIQRGALRAPEADLAAEMYRSAQAQLARHGYEQYELSNWARPGHACRHNQVYWRNEPWLGLGAGAHGWLDGRRSENIASPTRYVASVRANRLPVAHFEPIDRHVEMSETMVLGLRMRQGVDLAAFARRFGCRLEDVYAEPLAELTDWGLVVCADGRLQLTPAALLVANEVFVRFLG
ncbi:MAG: radical SAM family heme chaperone HemW [Anaerolineae bacterium]